MTRTLHLRTVALAVALLAAGPLTAAPDGRQIYEAKCANCHGKGGEGTKRYKPALAGDRSVAQLTTLIAETMPEDDPSLTADEAAAVAKYVHESFYSPVARERNRPARVDLARLTVRQYRHAVADVVGSFRWSPKWGDERGLKGEYYKGRRFRPTDRVLERTDREVNFPLGTASPVPGKVEPDEFSMRWSGAVLPPETGEYRFVVRTEHAARLWVNDTNRPLVDAWVKSGNDTEYTGTIYLVGGRVYPLRLEYSKGKQGVDDSKKGGPKPPPEKTSIALLWAVPGRGATEVIADRFLGPNPAPEQFVSTVPFPPDDRSYGWERGTTVSKEWDAATTDGAIEAAGYVAARVEEFIGVKVPEKDRGYASGNPASINTDRGHAKPTPEWAVKAKQFAYTFAERAFRRPLTDEQKATIDRQFAAAKDLETAVKRVVLLTLKSPRFLYREVGGAGDAYDVAARLSFGLWDSVPDKELLAAAAKGQLATKEQVARQAERMLADPRGRAKLRGFLLTWAKADHGLDLAKDAKRFPGFDAAAVADLRASLELFLDDVAWSETSDFRRLFLDERVYLNGRLAKLYGADLPADAPFTKVPLDGGKRAGVLTHPYLMTSFAHSDESSPIHRGVFLARGVLGLGLRPPPEAVAPLAPDLHPSLTTRERVLLQTKPAACVTCHGVINPLGFTLENFDAIGRFRETDHGKPVDATGGYLARDGRRVTVNGARELAKFLADSQEAQEAFAEQMFHHLVQQPVRAYGPTADADLRRAFAASGFGIRKLAVEVMTLAALKNPERERRGTTAAGS
jgi:hypothetical protein